MLHRAYNLSMINLVTQKNISKSQQIKILMLLKGISGAEIARRAGVHRTMVYHVIEGRSKSHRIRKAIAEALKVGYKELWDK